MGINFLEAAFLRGFRPRSKMTGSQWADARRYVAPGTSPEPGEWRTERVPYLREPMDSMTDKRTEYVVMCCSSQIGKSEALLNVLGYYVDQEPSAILMVQPTVEAAEAFSKERIDPTIRYSPGLNDKFELEGKDGRGTSRKSSNTIREKKFPGGLLALVGANSTAGLASRPIRILLCDEIDRYGTTKEGDPVKLARQRTENYEATRKIILVSTPTIKGSSPIYEWYEKSDKREYYVTCPHCGHEYVWKWAQVKWDKDDEGNALPETAAMFCPDCGAQVRGAYKPDPRILATGRWKPTAQSKIKGYHVSSLYSPWVSLCNLVEEFTHATKNRDKAGLQEFINLKLGEPWEEVAVGEDDWEHLHRRREYYGTRGLPSGVLFLTCGVDVQRDRLECSVYGWGEGKECWGIEHRIIYGDPGGKELWQSLDSFLCERRELPNGMPLPISCTCVDSGDGQYTQEVYLYTRQRERQGVYAVKGRGGIGVPFVSKPTRGNRVGAALFVLGVDAGKSLVMGALKVEDEGAGFVHYAREKERGFDEEFCRCLCSEVLERTFEKGVVKMAWKKIRDRNEALDCAVYARAALEICNPNFIYLASVINGKKAAQSSAPPTPTAQKRRRGVMSKGVTF